MLDDVNSTTFADFADLKIISLRLGDDRLHFYKLESDHVANVVGNLSCIRLKVAIVIAENLPLVCRKGFPLTSSMTECPSVRATGGKEKFF
jgi:hypothetical protein